MLAAALASLADAGLEIVAAAPVIQSAPVGPSQHRYANSAAVISTDLAPEDLLALLKAAERAFGRKQRGQRWAARVLDLDIILWSGGSFYGKFLTIPHPAMQERDFVLAPAAAICPEWRDPISRLSIRQLHRRLTRPRAAPR
ncbi:2-amino-4-hydroxy-6-hydroxymethyldihydropteridine diphosphokinase [Allopontixanthobacter confluentis]|uniref:2-amino-4-hydroxy-6- hydroxymethyldihydropteridine diphosphokinase n=1 Tax=Allopontixanthobacter confluentis TaxID=1849021 RepID=UPI002FCD7EF3